MTDISDEQLRRAVEKASTKDADSCKKLYDLLVDAVYAYVRSRTYTQEQAIDITQDVFIDVFAALDRFTYKTRAQFYSYIFVIARRKLASLYADATMRHSYHVEFQEEHMSPQEDVLGNTMQSDAVQRALAPLTDIAREIIVLHHWSRYTFGEIALLLNMEESAVRVRHHRALKLLATTLEGNDEI